MRIKCAVCGRIYQAKIPTGGDGSLLWPRQHNRIFTNKKLRAICPGSHQEAELIEEKGNG